MSASDIRSQWINPSDILSLLLLVGGDVVQVALAQQSGDRLPTPVVFSFGWVAYAFTALLSAVGDNLLLPSTPDMPVQVLSKEHSYVRSNDSWIIGRLLRDYEKSWMPVQAQTELENMLKLLRKRKAGLCVSVFRAADAPAGVPVRDLYWFSGYVVAVVQLGIAAIPWGIWGEWEIFVIAACGNALAFAAGSLPQWRNERWNCRRKSEKTFIVSRGNGAQHALVIVGAGHGLDLEDLASSKEGVNTSWVTKTFNAGLAVCWVVLLVTVSGMHSHTWYLVAIGALGMVHTVVIAGSPRRPETFGFYLEFERVFIDAKIMKTLQHVENAYPGVGKAMLPTFFPGELQPNEEKWWREAKEKEMAQEKTGVPKGLQARETD